MRSFSGQPPILQPIPHLPLIQQSPPRFYAMPLQQQVTREQQLQQLQLQIQQQQLQIQLQQRLIIEEQQRRIKEQQRRIKEQQRRIEEQQRRIEEPLTNDYIRMAGQLGGVTNFIDHFKKYKIPTDQSDCFGRTLLHCAVYYNDLESVKFLLEKHVDSRDKDGMYVNSRNNEGLTALHYCALLGNIEAVKALLQAKEVNPNLGDKNGMTALHYVVRDGNIEAVKALLQAKEVNPNVSDSIGLTPLHFASYNVRSEVVEALNASCKARGKKTDVNRFANGEGFLSGKKPMELATLSTSSDYEKIKTMALLYKYGGKIGEEEFFKNPKSNKLISEDLNENIRKLNTKNPESFSVNDFMIDVEARAKLKKNIEDMKLKDKIIKDITKDVPSPIVHPIINPAKRVKVNESFQSSISYLLN